MPVRRQFARHAFARAGDQVQQLLADRVEFARSFGPLAVAAAKAQRQDLVDQLDDMHVLLRRGHQPAQQLEHFLAAVSLLVALDQQAVRRPVAGFAPAGRIGGLVQRGAERVARGKHMLAAQVGALADRLEQPDLLHQHLLQRLRRANTGQVRRHVGQRAQQRLRRGKQGIGAGRNTGGALLRRFRCAPAPCGTPWRGGIRGGRGGPVDGVRDGGRRHGLVVQHAGNSVCDCVFHQLRTPHNSRRISGKCPATCNARPP
ncbi:hypothetical protein D3C72_1148580 [compost metagenome]